MVPTKDERLPEQSKASYEPPVLHCLGDLRNLTLGGSGCTPDSASGTQQRHPVFCP